MTSSKSHIEFKANRRFRRLALNTVIVLYLLIIAGGVVRSTGSGMGCPDWPKCFGRWVPPTEASQLPTNYKELYGAKLKGEVEFNPVKTWTEYVNRLLGAFTGVMIFLTLLASIHFIKSGQRKIFYNSLAAFLLVGFQGWLGAKVVSFELLPVIVTLHMLVAIVIVFILLYLFTWSSFYTNDLVKTTVKVGSNWLGVVVLLLSLVQILMGTQVRESIDVAVSELGYINRNSWIDSLGAPFYVHRSFSIIVLIANLVWTFDIMKAETAATQTVKAVKICVCIVFAELLTGLVLAYGGVPPYAQPLHLVLAILLIGLQFVVLLLKNKEKYLTGGEKHVAFS